MSFATPANNGAAITAYSVSTGKSYTCAVHATNARGAGPNAASGAVIVGAPAAPATQSAAKVASGSLKLTFTAPASNGAAITGYTIACTPSNAGAAKTMSATASPATVSGLTAGKTYTCIVSAKNSRGASVPSAVGWRP